MIVFSKWECFQITLVLSGTCQWKLASEKSKDQRILDYTNLYQIILTTLIKWIILTNLIVLIMMILKLIISIRLRKFGISSQIDSSCQGFQGLSIDRGTILRYHHLGSVQEQARQWDPQSLARKHCHWTQDIDSITWIISPFKKNANSVEKKIQVKDSIPWVRCASDINVLWLSSCYI